MASFDLMPSPASSIRVRVENLGRRSRAFWDTVPPNVQGICWILLSGVFFTAMSAMIKLLGQHIPVIEILFVRQLVLSLICLPSILRSQGQAFRTPFPGLHGLRVALSCIAMSTGFTSIVHLPLADAVAIGFSKSFFVTLFAIAILGERVGFSRWATTISGFLGVIVMLQPSPAGMDIYALLAVVSAAAVGLIMVIIRKLAQKERLVTVMTYQSVGVGLVFIIPAYLSWTPPTLTEWAVMLIIGWLSAVAQNLNFNGFRVGEAAAVASADYLRLVYATGLGIWLFSELPSTATLIGAVIIIATSLYSLHYERGLAQAKSRKSQADEHGALVVDAAP